MSPGRPRPDSAILRPEEELRFDVLYRGNCAGCHGADGKNGAALELANPEYQAWVNEAALRKWIAGGMPQTQMPAFAVSAGGPLTPQQIEVLIHGMRQRWAPQTPSQPGRMPYLQTGEGDADRGAQVFDRSCRSCHKQSKQEITSPDYLALVSDQALRTVIVAGLPGIGAPDGLHSDPMSALTEQDVSDVVKFLGSLRSATPGQPYSGNREGAE
jgi:mono/diheme cytochrome c family protein